MHDIQQKFDYAEPMIQGIVNQKRLDSEKDFQGQLKNTMIGVLIGGLVSVAIGFFMV